MPNPYTTLTALKLKRPLEAAQLNRSANRDRHNMAIGTNGAALTNSTQYKSRDGVGLAATITAIYVSLDVAPIGGTNTLRILNGSSSGNSVLAGASFDLTTLTNNSLTSIPLDATGVNLALAANQGLYIEWNAGVQTTAAVNPIIIIEYLLADV